MKTPQRGDKIFKFNYSNNGWDFVGKITSASIGCSIFEYLHEATNYKRLASTENWELWIEA